MDISFKLSSVETRDNLNERQSFFFFFFFFFFFQENSYKYRGRVLNQISVPCTFHSGSYLLLRKRLSP